MYNNFAKTFSKHIKLHYDTTNGRYDHFFESLPALEVYRWCKRIEAEAKEQAFRTGTNLGIVCTTIIWVLITLTMKLGG